jgi:hypothetical protein
MTTVIGSDFHPFRQRVSLRVLLRRNHGVPFSANMFRVSLKGSSNWSISDSNCRYPKISYYLNFQRFCLSHSPPARPSWRCAPAGRGSMDLRSEGSPVGDLCNSSLRCQGEIRCFKRYMIGEMLRAKGKTLFETGSDASWDLELEPLILTPHQSITSRSIHGVRRNISRK